ncbi:type II secretion system F family protein [Paenibacillus sp. L3-i20]|uniref:type II secretion system F family protein n=1 Tax=Paenibacillus sp. L3-i20 TaxID=2905833 RepID=UPI001EE0C7F3|nr:hypothetical protein [Paenibacillus sp. L3-i20]GKU76162.1 hypothetical protein L3i20_v205590 [Paenibacillus sp. L3-i20]
MNDVSIVAAGILLFTLLFICIFSILLYLVHKRRLKNRLTYVAPRHFSHLLGSRYKQWGLLRKHMSELLETLRIKIKGDIFLGISGLLFLVGVVVGGLFFQTAKGTILFGLVVGLAPYVWLRGLLIHRRMGAQMDFLPAVELFYQCYLVTGERQVRIALQRTVEEKRLLGPMQAVFEQLYRNLSVRGDDDTSLRLMAASLGNVWADYFVNILRVSLSEGVSISESLRELLGDMRKARRANEQERHRLLEIRIANFTPILFLGLFIGINIKYNKTNSYYYYLLDPQGRDMLLNALLLIFASFLMGLWLSRKKM